MATIPQKVQDLADALRHLPQIGPRQALRLSLALFRNPGMRQRIASALDAVGEETLICERCFRITDTNPCDICTANKRDLTRLLVVEEDTDLAQIESTGAYHGLYFVLGGRFSTKQGPAEDQGLRMPELRKRLEADKETLEEVIVGINPTIEGEALIRDVLRLAKDAGLAASRLGRGLPTGGEIEYADEETLRSALEHRT